MVMGLALAPSAVSASPTPDAGPAAGGTTVTGSLEGVTFTQVDAGRNTSIALDTDGNAYSWGWNLYGQLGDGTVRTDRSTPVRVVMPTDVKFVQVDAGDDQAVALGDDGRAYQWGRNISIQPVLAPSAPAGVNYTQVRSATGTFVALGDDGNVYTWGDDSRGQLGNGLPLISSSTPVQVQLPAGMRFTQVEGSDYGSWFMALNEDGELYGWGANIYGNFGDGVQNPLLDTPPGVVDNIYELPVQTLMPAGVTFTDFDIGINQGLALGSDGNTYGWGRNDFGKVGSGGTVQTELVPTQVVMPTGVTFTQVSTSGLQESAALGDDGNSYSWGANYFGQLGRGSITPFSSPRADEQVPGLVQVPAGVSFTQIDAGYGHMVALSDDGHLYGWGVNNNGQVGDGTTTNRSVPVLISAVTATSVTFDTFEGSNLTTTDGTWSVETPPGGTLDGGLFDGPCADVTVEVESQQFGRALPPQVFTDGFTYGAPGDVVTQPVSGTVPDGGGEFVTSVELSGDEAPAVQWQSAPTETGPWTDIDGAVSTTLTLTVSEDTYVRAYFENCFMLRTVEEGSVSDPALVTVEPAVTTTTEPPVTTTTEPPVTTTTEPPVTTFPVAGQGGTAPPTTPSPTTTFPVLGDGGTADPAPASPTQILPATGSSTSQLLLVALVLMLAGGATILVARARTRTHTVR